MAKASAIFVTTLFLAASSMSAHAMMRTNTLNLDYKYGKFQTGAAPHNLDMTKPPKAKRRAKAH